MGFYSLITVGKKRFLPSTHTNKKGVDGAGFLRNSARSSSAQGHFSCLGTQTEGGREEEREAENGEAGARRWKAQASLTFQPEIADVPGTKHAHPLLARGCH